MMITFSHIEFTYDGQTDILRGIDLHIERGQFVAVLGGNGSGKSTLAKHMNALLVPDAGEVVVDGLSTADDKAVYLIRSKAGMVLQNPDDQIVASVVEDDVAFGPENLGLDPADIRQRVTDALAEVGLSGYEARKTHELSGGQKQRVAIAGVLAMRPQVLILDEASAMLDPRGRRGLLRVCRALHDAGMTIVYITHFMGEAAAADRVVVMENGRIALDGTPADVLTRRETLRRLHLTMPFSASLSYALQERHFDCGVHIERESLAASIAEKLSLAGVPRTMPHVSQGAESAFPARVEAANPEGVEPLIELSHVSHAYGKRSAPALDDVTIAVGEGEFLGIAGHTGSGKSTLIQMLNGILSPTKGRVSFRGADLSDKANAKQARAEVGVVFQYPENQLFAATVLDDVAFGPRNMGLDEDEVNLRVREALAQVNLDADEVGGMSPFELSGGQQRRVAFAGVLAMRPRVLVLDEPAAGLDPQNRSEFLSLVKRLHEGGITVVMVSHSMDDLAWLTSRICVLCEGRIVASGTPMEIFAHDAELRRVGLGIPASLRMAKALREEGFAIAEELYDIDDLAGAIVALANTSAGVRRESPAPRADGEGGIR